MRLRAAVVSAVLATTSLTACVGPATTNDAYRGKALHAAHAAVSELESSRLAVDTMLAGRLQHLYTETMLSASEDALSSVQQSFDSIQPPESRVADDLRASLDQLLSDANDSVRELRIAARRHDDATLRSVVGDIGKTIDELNTYLEHTQ